MTKEEIINSLSRGEEPDIIIYRLKYDNCPYVVSYFSDGISLMFRITHLPDGRMSRLTSVINEGIIIIGDIKCVTNNNGYGTVLVNELINYAIENRMKVIKGWISNVDCDHLDRLVHFYSKFGFEILLASKDEKETLKYADIILKLA